MALSKLSGDEQGIISSPSLLFSRLQSFPPSGIAIGHVFQVF